MSSSARRPSPPRSGEARALQEEIAASGYFPALIADAVTGGVGEEEILSYCLHLEPTFTRDEVHRHLTVLVLTPTRLVLVHTDEAPVDPRPEGDEAESRPGGDGQAVLSVESIRLSGIVAVALTKVVAEPARWQPGRSGVSEAWLNVGWGTMRRLELEPAGCEDPQCTADHGYTGTLTPDDLTLRVSVAADGQQRLDRLVAFAEALQQASGVRGGR
ncbi:phosphodiesterase [Desertihabitans brevis]|uniref:Phosphodiesterase n=1 Tax=Desertihabitans brevis TaxID=2268447 RepID=A0A367Z0Q6_9ACTN|nr:phosphodiesterase [Desertihabitans brevis]